MPRRHRWAAALCLFAISCGGGDDGECTRVVKHLASLYAADQDFRDHQLANASPGSEAFRNARGACEHGHKGRPALTAEQRRCALAATTASTANACVNPSPQDLALDQVTHPGSGGDPPKPTSTALAEVTCAQVVPRGLVDRVLANATVRSEQSCKDGATGDVCQLTCTITAPPRGRALLVPPKVNVNCTDKASDQAIRDWDVISAIAGRDARPVAGLGKRAVANDAQMFVLAENDCLVTITWPAGDPPLMRALADAALTALSQSP